MRYRHLLLIALLTAACGRDKPEPPPQLGEAIPNFPLPPDGKVVAHSGGSNALQFQFVSPQSTEAMAQYYRGLFGKPPWKLINDVKMADGSVSFYTVAEAHPLWVTIRPGPGGTGSQIDVIGAKVN